MFSSGTTNDERMVIAHSANYPTWGLQYQDLSDKFRFLSAGVNVMAVDLSNKRVGITTSSPQYPLHVSGNNVTAYVTSDFLDPDQAAMKVEVSSVFNYSVRGLHCKSSSGNSSSTAGYFESDFIGVDGHSNGNGGTAYGTSGVATGGTAAYGAYGSASGATFKYGVYGTVSGSGTKYGVYSNGNFGGTGTYLYSSDKKLKKNIKPITNVLDKLMQLRPAMYDFRVGEFGGMNLAEGKHFGFIAQEVKEVFPDLVATQVFPPQYDEKNRKVAEAIDYLGLNYTEFIPVIIEGMQEQQEIIKKQSELISQLEKRLQALEKNNLVNIGSASNTDAVFQPRAADILSIAPNPVVGNATVAYFIPENINQAFLQLKNSTGETVSQSLITQKGKAKMSLNTSSLSAGTYFLTLFCNYTAIKTIQIEIR